MELTSLKEDYIIFKYTIPNVGYRINLIIYQEKFIVEHPFIRGIKNTYLFDHLEQLIIRIRFIDKEVIDKKTITFLFWPN